MEQYTITESNEWEGEVWGYILELTEEEYIRILKSFERLSDNDDDSFSIRKTNYTDEQVAMINDHSLSSYMERLCFYELPPNFEEVEIDEDTFYKSGILIK